MRTKILKVSAPCILLTNVHPTELFYLLRNRLYVDKLLKFQCPFPVIHPTHCKHQKTYKKYIFPRTKINIWRSQKCDQNDENCELRTKWDNFLSRLYPTYKIFKSQALVYSGHVRYLSLNRLCCYERPFEPQWMSMNKHSFQSHFHGELPIVECKFNFIDSIK